MKKPSLFEILFKNDEQRGSHEAAAKSNFFSRQFSGSVSMQVKNRRGKAIHPIKALGNLITHASSRAYGLILLTFGFVGIMMYILRLGVDNDILTPILGAILSLLSLPLLFADKPLPILFSRFPFVDHLLYDILCIKRHTSETVAKFPMALSVIIGFGLAVTSAFVPFWQVALSLGVLVFGYVGLESPEFVFLTSLFTLPYLRFLPHGDVWLVAAVVFALASFLIKVLYGKRVFYVEQYDIFIGVMLIFLLISGIFLKGEASFSGSLRMIVLSIGYILSGNIITNRRLAERSVNAVIVSAVISSIVSFIQLIMLVIGSGGLSLAEMNGILARQDGMSVFFIIGLILAGGMIKQASQHSRGAYIFSVVIILCAMVLSGEIFAFLASFLAIPVYYILKNDIRPGLFIPLLLILPMALLLIPNSILDSIFYLSPSIVSADDLFALWNSSLGVWSKNLLFGIGIGAESFADEMAALGIFGHPDASNLFIELGLEAGVFALLSFFCILITRLKHRAIHYLYVRNSQIERLSCIAGASMFALLAFGMVNYIWSEPSAYYFFWCIFGMGSAALRVARKDYDDRVIYYEESSAFDSAVIDIEIG